MLNLSHYSFTICLSYRFRMSHFRTFVKMIEIKSKNEIYVDKRNRDPLTMPSEDQAFNFRSSLFEIFVDPVLGAPVIGVLWIREKKIRFQMGTYSRE